MIGLQFCYVVAGLVFASYTVLSAPDRSNPKRIGTAAFWGLFAASFLFGSYLKDWQNGLLVLALIVLGGFGLLGHGSPETTTSEVRRESANRRADWLFAPALLVPAVALLGTLFLKQARIGNGALVDAKNVTVISLVWGIVMALAVAILWLRPRLLAPMQEGRRLADMVGWAIILPQLLASLGAIFALSGVGKAVGEIATRYLPLDQPFEAVVVYCVGMAAFTAIMGNAFAAFPVMTAAIGLPLIVHQFHGNPAITALLDLPDRNAVIKAQLPTAGLMLIANTLLMYILVFRF
jgi:uncharacterized membrane protein